MGPFNWIFDTGGEILLSHIRAREEKMKTVAQSEARSTWRSLY